MKKIIIFGYNMEMGGAERALINVLNLIYKQCEIDLVLLEKKGPLLKEIPKTVNVIEIKTNIFKYVLFRFVPFARKNIINHIAKKKYDIAIAFMEGRAATFVADLNQKCKKIAWIHNDVNLFDIGIKEKEIKDSYNKMDVIVAVSKVSRKSFYEKYGIDKEKVIVIYNMIDEKQILKKANVFTPNKDVFTFINVSKMRPQKRHDRLLKAVATLKEEGYIFRLLLVGDGPLYDKIKKLSKKLEIDDYVDFLGLLENPFPYIKIADYFVMSSDHEGYPLSLLESLLLKTPVITTDVSGAREILHNGDYGIICDISLEGITNAMRKVLNEKQDNIIYNLKNYHGANDGIEDDIKKLFEINK